jgi:hypothetical protein
MSLMPLFEFDANQRDAFAELVTLTRVPPWPLTIWPQK